ncbi:DUF2442 domain-containing protein [candidate division WOR-3 bacterium]|nr:DUF2442 domain-containing protein [candidate division WOR-3 bacterium]MCK4527929.1 DUF2442 domain-containing protein [candidate division WOR-3 bacterium]
MHEVKDAHYVNGYILEVEFEDGKRKRINFEEYLYGEVFEPLKSFERFKNFRIDRELGTIVWNTGADFCPDFLYSHAKGVSA